MSFLIKILDAMKSRLTENIKNFQFPACANFGVSIYYIKRKILCLNSESWFNS
jgi:hypothetical protein